MGEDRPACKIPAEEPEGRSARSTSRPGRFSSGEIRPSIHRRLGGSQSHSRHFGEDKFLPLPGIETRFPGCPPRSLFSIRPAISRLKEWQRYEYIAADSVGRFRHSLFWFRRDGNDRSRWPRRLRRETGAARLLGLRVRISPVAWMSVSCKCCVFYQVEVSATDRFFVQRNPTECGVCVCVCVCVCVLL